MTSVGEDFHELFAVMSTLTHTRTILEYVNVVTFMLYGMRGQFLSAPVLTPDNRVSVNRLQQRSLAPKLVFSGLLAF